MKNLLARLNDMPLRMKQLRTSKNLSQKSAAAQAGLCQQGWMRYEKGGAMPGADAIVRICTRFEVSADWLLGLTDDNNSPSAVVVDSAIAKEVEELRAKVAKLNEELLQSKGVIAGLNKAIEMLTKTR